MESIKYDKYLNIDVDSTLILIEEIIDRIKEISYLFHEDNQDILKHLLATSIHMILFINDLYCIFRDKKSIFDENLINEFINNCGCNFNKDK